MTFDNEFKPNRDNLNPRIAEMMDRAFYRNRANGQNVQFVNEVGSLCEFSLESVAKAVEFSQKLSRQGVTSVLSA